jgi:hypothetical protein
VRIRDAESSTPEAWRPYITGNIDIIDVDCSHEDMLLPGPSDIIGRWLADHVHLTGPLSVPTFKNEPKHG